MNMDIDYVDVFKVKKGNGKKKKFESPLVQVRLSNRCGDKVGNACSVSYYEKRVELDVFHIIWKEEEYGKATTFCRPFSVRDEINKVGCAVVGGKYRVKYSLKPNDEYVKELRLAVEEGRLEKGSTYDIGLLVNSLVFPPPDTGDGKTPKKEPRKKRGLGSLIVGKAVAKESGNSELVEDMKELADMETGEHKDEENKDDEAEDSKQGKKAEDFAKEEKGAKSIISGITSQLFNNSNIEDKVDDKKESSDEAQQQ